MLLFSSFAARFKYSVLMLRFFFFFVQCLEFGFWMQYSKLSDRFFQFYLTNINKNSYQIQEKSDMKAIKK